jgi:hypothetical protein
MQRRRVGAIGFPLFLAILCGCEAKTEPVDTGARAAAQSYCDALVRQDWASAYGALDARDRSRRSVDQFRRQAQRYRQALGFEPDTVHIRACEEHDEEAIAHVLWTGRQGMRSRPYRDALVLRRGAAGWGVILPRHFGENQHSTAR